MALGTLPPFALSSPALKPFSNLPTCLTLSLSATIPFNMLSRISRLAKSHALMRAGQGRRMLRQKGARHAHAAIRASGRVPGQEARAARKVNAARRREEKAKQASLGVSWRYSSTDLTGI